MKKIEEGKINIKDIKFLENSRIREKEDVGDLMQDIDSNGLLHNIGIRKEDNAIIFGNRRAKACRNLGWSKIDCNFFADVDDNDLLIKNISENVKRKDVGSIEIGRLCQILLEKGFNKNEIAVKLGFTKLRVDSCMSAYNVTKGTPFEKLITRGYGNKMDGKISEGLIWKIQNSLSKVLKKKITNEQWKILLKAAEDGKINSKNISVLRYILSTDPKKNIKSAIKKMKSTKVVYTYVPVHADEFEKEKHKLKTNSDIDTIMRIMSEHNKNLVF